MKRKQKISDLINEVEEHLVILKDLQDKAKDDPKMISLAEPKVGHVIHDLRKCLEYAARDIYEKMNQLATDKGTPLPSKQSHYPYAAEEKDFKSSLNKNLPNVEALLPGVYRLIYSIQPFLTDDKWLLDLASFDNNFKHDIPPEQKRSNRSSIAIEGESMFDISDNSLLIIEKMDYKGEIFTDLKFDNGDLSFTTTGNADLISMSKSASFYLSESNVEVIPTLEKFLLKVVNHVDSIYALL